MTTWTWAAPCSGRIRGAWRVSSSRWSQSTRRPAWTASSTRAVPGTTAASADEVVGEPRGGGDGQAGGEQDVVGAGYGDGGAQQRVPGDPEAEAAGVGGGPGGVQPVAAAAEGVRRQVDSAGAGPGEHGTPVDVGVRGRTPRRAAREQRAALRPVAAQHADGDGDADGRQRGEDRVGADLEEAGDAEVGGGGADRVVEAYGLEELPYPVAGVVQSPSPQRRPVRVLTAGTVGGGR